MLHMEYSRKGLELTKHFEAEGGPALASYFDELAKIWTIGYGHTQNVKEGMFWTQEQCEEALNRDICWAVETVNHLVYLPSLTQNQFDALVDFVFNTGAGSFKSSALLSKLNTNDMQGVEEEFKKWIYSRGHLVPGLVRRRAAETALFSTTTN